MKKLAVFLLASIVWCFAPAQSDTAISILTAYPGPDIYELEGHSAIRINYGDGRDYAVSYGMFNFNEPGFVYRFVKGETDYMVGLVPFERFIKSYASQNRLVEELPLNLTSLQKQKLIELIAINLEPQNRVYRYNYVKDNCSTRPLAMIEKALGDTINSSWHSVESMTFRDIMRTYHKNYPWYQFGIDLALGSGIDYRLTDREYAFVPMIMAAQVEASPISGRPEALTPFTPDQGIEGPTPWWCSPLAVCWAFFGMLAVFTIRDILRQRTTRWVDAVFFAILGVAGLLLTFLIFVSVHEATSPNWLYIWLNPLCLIVPVLIWIRRAGKIVYYYMAADFCVVALGLIMWPWFGQSANPAFLPLVLATLIREAAFVINAKRSTVI